MNPGSGSSGIPADPRSGSSGIPVNPGSGSSGIPADPRSGSSGIPVNPGSGNAGDPDSGSSRIPADPADLRSGSSGIPPHHTSAISTRDTSAQPRSGEDQPGRDPRERDQGIPPQPGGSPGCSASQTNQNHGGGDTLRHRPARGQPPRFPSAARAPRGSAHLSLDRKISCRIPFSRSAWVKRSRLPLPGTTRGAGSSSSLG